MRRYPSLARLLREWRPLMDIPKGLVIRAHYVNQLDWLAKGDSVYGLTACMPGGGLILIDMQQCKPAMVEPTLVHELVHIEQIGKRIELDHGAYFAQREAEIKERFGVII
jgi:hypothetical protein